MSDFDGLLASDYGFKPQGKAAPMAASRSSRSSNLPGASSFDDYDSIFGASVNNYKSQDGGGLDGYPDVFRGPPKYTSASESRGGDSGYNFDSMFGGSTSDMGVNKTTSLPKYDKPLYDDDIFDGVPGLRGSSTVKYDDVFSSVVSPSKSSTFDDLLGSLSGTRSESNSSKVKRSDRVENDVEDFDDLLSGFGGSNPRIARQTSETRRPSKTAVDAARTASNMMEDPFVVIGSASPAKVSSPKAHSQTASFDESDKFNMYGNSKFDVSSLKGKLGDDMDPLSDLGKSMPAFSSIDSFSVRSPENQSERKMPDSNSYSKSARTMSDTSTTASNIFVDSFGQTDSPPAYDDPRHSVMNEHVNMSLPTFEEDHQSSNDVWLTVSEVPLFTPVTKNPPPSRPPPPIPAKNAFKSSRKTANEFSSVPNSSQYFEASNNASVSQIDQLEDLAMGKTRINAYDHLDVETNSDAAASAAAMKKAMDRAEAKFKHAKEVRERENAKATRNRESVQVEKDERDIGQNERHWKEREERRMDEERERNNEEAEREREEKEREERKLQKEKERAREIERERQRQAVERATREARERASIEARSKAEKATVEKASAEARQRAERAAVQRVQSEARERAAAEAKERAEKAAAEAKERAKKAAAEAKENAEAKERAARAETDARIKAERAAVDRAASEARQRAAAAARERADAAKVNQHNNDNDLESFFSAGNRPSSAPKARDSSLDPLFDNPFQTKTGPEVAKRTSVGTSSSMRKTSSTTNITDDLSSIFGAAPSSRDFQAMDGESEDRRRARLERHQRTQERAAKALAEKNQRDLQVQKDQAERNRIGETLDAEIKRWSAGKEGNLRALLSTLQYVLWPECGWQPVSLTDLIVGASVKKVYRKATLCIHPDKVQQKGATLQQKYVAEKVFDLLKEAWNKFNSEELF